MKTLFISPTRPFLASLVMTPLLVFALTSRPYGDQPVTPAAHDSAPPALVPEAARSAFDFVNSIGVNTHLNYFDTQYGNFPFVSRELQKIGIRHLRDGIHLQNADYNHAIYGRWIDLGKLGIRFDAVLDPRSKLGPLTPALLENVDQLSGHTIESFEGPNELDISNTPDWPSVDRDYQQTIFRAAQSLSDRQAIKLIAPSLAFASHAPELGDMSEYIDEGNLHPYPAGKTPSVLFPEQIDLARIMAGTKPIVITETGYHNGLNDHSDQPGVSDSAAAKYIPRLYLESFANGVARTYLYEFLDEAADTGLKSFQLHWGLIRSDGSEKPAFVALENLIAELNDAAEPQHLGSLAWSINSNDPHIHHVLVQKSTGEFDLVLWQEIPSYNQKAQAEIQNPRRPAVLTLSRKARSIALYEPVKQADPVQTYAKVSQVAIEIPDHPLVIRILLQ
jgi:hypothetical protein